MSSASKKLRLENAQHVPERFWFLIDVIGFSFTVVNWNPSVFSCANADVPSAISTAAIRVFFMFCNVLFVKLLIVCLVVSSP
jgi:hypothetical protein